MPKLKVLDLFSGIGGFSLGLERAGMETVGFCEIDPFCQKVLRKHWPRTLLYEDVKNLAPIAYTLEYHPDVICGGFPCQPFSTAARGRNNAEDLWPAMACVIRNFMPMYVILENVAEYPIELAESYLIGIGYETWTKCISASDCGADHQRSRWWLCAYPNDKSELPLSLNAEVAKLPELCKGVWSGEAYAESIRVSDGIPDRVHRLRALGNSVLPQTPEAIGRAIIAVDNPVDNPRNG